MVILFLSHLNSGSANTEIPHRLERAIMPITTFLPELSLWKPAGSRIFSDKRAKWNKAKDFALIFISTQNLYSLFTLTTQPEYKPQKKTKQTKIPPNKRNSLQVFFFTLLQMRNAHSTISLQSWWCPFSFINLLAHRILILPQACLLVTISQRTEDYTQTLHSLWHMLMTSLGGKLCNECSGVIFLKTTNGKKRHNEGHLAWQISGE